MSELVFDLVEDILMRLDVEDLLRCKSVCKSWLSFISSSRFVKDHLDYNKNKDHNNHELGDRRIFMPSTAANHFCYIVGSSNGLVCVSSKDAQVLVMNPSTREVKKFQPPFTNFSFHRHCICWGFGHDSFTDDYKVVIGGISCKTGTLFQVFSLKLNIWKVIGQINYEFAGYGRCGFLWNGALHWIVKDCSTRKRVILSFNLCREEFKEIPHPSDSIFERNYLNKLGILKECLCIIRHNPYKRCPYKRWILKNHNDKDSWFLYDDDCEMNKYDAIHTLNPDFSHIKWHLSDDDRICLASTNSGAPIFVRSLVSPHLNGKPKAQKE